jgi:transcription elongation factor GreA
MSIERVPITPDGYENMKKELENLIRVERPNVIKLIEEARAFGDLSENAEYESAKDRQSFIEGRIQELESKVSRAEVIDPAKITNKERVTFGLTVKLEDLDSGEEVTYQLVGPDETEPENGRISITSPIGRAMLGKHLDDDVSVNTPGGLREFVVLEIL